MTDRSDVNEVWEEFKTGVMAGYDPPSYMGVEYDECEWFNTSGALHRTDGKPAQVSATTAESAVWAWKTYAVKHPGIIMRYWVAGAEFRSGTCVQYCVASFFWERRQSGRLTKAARP